MALSAMHAAQDARLQALRSKHALLSKKVEKAQQSPSMTDIDIRMLKRQKLMIKEQIEGIRESA